MTITVHHKVPVTVERNEIKLPFYFSTGKYSKSLCCMTEDMVLIDMHMNGPYSTIDIKKYDDVEDASLRLEREFCSINFEEIDQALFMHKFSEVHRELFYLVNPKLKPNA